MALRGAPLKLLFSFILFCIFSFALTAQTADNTAKLKTKENEIWSKISAKTKPQATITSRKSPILRYLVPMAAAAAIALVIFFNLS